MPTSIGSLAQWRQTLGSHSIVVADFYADWCGPCKMIAPTFESLATKYAKPNRIAFCKVDVDNQTEVAKQYGVSAMPTFLVLRNGSVIETIRGANPPALTAAVEKAVKLAGPGAGSGATFSGAGQRLGGIGVGRTAAGAASRPSALARFDLRAFLNGVVAFFGMYFWTLFSLDPYKAAESSPFARGHNPLAGRPGTTGGTRLGGSGATRPRFGTMADVGSS